MAKPSAMAVLPTPGSPTSSGLFLVRRQDLNRPFNFRGAADQGVDFAFLRLLVQIDAIGVQRLGAFLVHFFRLGVFIRATDRPGGRTAGLSGHLGDAVADIVDGIETGHVLQLQEIDGMAFAFREYGDKDIGPRHFLTAG